MLFLPETARKLNEPSIRAFIDMDLNFVRSFRINVLVQVLLVTVSQTPIFVNGHFQKCMDCQCWGHRFLIDIRCPVSSAMLSSMAKVLASSAGHLVLYHHT
ncbi:hypothetical protein M514_25366 [Trichuris suis]|uniref:Uncharacterized protein n=1 Tax=Trichuris suis TaxID=68888 RepID=A0A085MYY7_9BILA|nr:hypothetical protein M514_25366 [Trichuris suis]